MEKAEAERAEAERVEAEEAATTKAAAERAAAEQAAAEKLKAANARANKLAQEQLAERRAAFKKNQEIAAAAMKTLFALEQLGATFTKDGDGNVIALNLNSTKISDVELRKLKAFPQLRDLSLNNTNVTDAGVADLQKALPNCKISH
jgi:hypothetical protein